MKDNQYYRVEVIANPDRIGTGFAFGKEVDPGQMLVDQKGLTGIHAERLLTRRDDQVSGDKTFTKNCIANYIPGLREATTIVHIPTKDVNGDRIPMEQWNALFLQACALYGVPL